MSLKTVQPKFIVGIGGSAGALKAYKALLDALPHDTDMAFVIISHMNPTAHSQLAKILQRHTKMSVLVASEAMPTLANHVYVIPPDSDLTMENYRFRVISPRIGRNKQVDIFFTSLVSANFQSNTSGEIGVSSLIDTWIIVRMVEDDDGRKRTREVFIVKSRGSNHDSDVHKFILSDDGIILIPYAKSKFIGNKKKGFEKNVPENRKNK